MKVAILYSHSSHNGIIDALKEKGYEVHTFFYGYIEGFINRLANRFYKKEYIIKKFNTALIRFYQTHQNEKFDAVLIFKGHQINDNSRMILSSLPILKIQWTTDSCSRFPGQMSLFPYVDKIFIQDGADLNQNYHKKMIWFPLGFDQTLFKYNPIKEFDLLLLGNQKQPFYKTRLAYILEASKIGKKDISVVFAGGGLNDSSRKILEENRVKIITSPPLPVYAKLISKAKICINIHQDDGGKAVNPLLFAIAAVGGIQVNEEYIGPKDYLSRWTYLSPYIVNSSKESLLETIDEVLNNYTLPIEENLMIFNQKHSYKALVDKLFD